MLDWKEIVQNYIIKYSNQIRKTTQPLRDHFGINYFTYHQIDSTGKYTVLVDSPEWAEHYVNEKIFLDDPYLRHPDVYKSGTCFMEDNGTEEYKENLIKNGKAVLNMDTGIILIQKQENLVEFFGCGGNKNTSSLRNLYLNHPQLLKSFAAHFKSELSHILTNMNKEANTLLTLKGKDFLCNAPIHSNITAETRLSYLKDLGLQLEIEIAETLSPREKECLKLLVKEKSAKETAAILGLSPRTIESYFENIKGKLSCWSKQEVLKIARNLHDLDLL